MIAAFTMLQADYSVAVFANGDEHTLWDLARDQFGSQVPMKRAGQPSEIGPAYVYLACEESSYMSGQTLHLNGGVILNT